MTPEHIAAVAQLAKDNRIDLYQCARAVIECAAEDIDFVGVAEQHEDAWSHLAPEHERLIHLRVHDLATSATITVSWPDEPPAEVTT